MLLSTIIASAFTPGAVALSWSLVAAVCANLDGQLLLLTILLRNGCSLMLLTS